MGKTTTIKKEQTEPPTPKRRRGRPPIEKAEDQKDSLSLYVGKVVKERIESEAARLGLRPSDVGDLALQCGIDRAIRLLESRARKASKALATA